MTPDERVLRLLTRMGLGDKGNIYVFPGASQPLLLICEVWRDAELAKLFVVDRKLAVQLDDWELAVALVDAYRDGNS